MMNISNTTKWILGIVAFIAVMMFLKKKGYIGATSTAPISPVPMASDAVVGKDYSQGELYNEKFSAAGGGCGAASAPNTFVSGTNGCNFLSNCEDNGGIGAATEQVGGGWALTCNGGGMIVVGPDGGKARPVRRTRSFF